MFDCGCFVAGTLVHTDKGSVPIEQIKVGDMVLSKHENGEGEQAYKPVVHVFSPTEAPIVQLSYYSILNPMNNLKAQLLYLTAGHLIWVVKDLDENPVNQWLPLRDIEPGSQAMLADGCLIEIGSIKEVLTTNTPNIAHVYDGMYEFPEIVVDFRDSKIKTYYVGENAYILDPSQSNKWITSRFSDDTIVPDTNCDVMRQFDGFLNSGIRPDFYTTLVYNFEVADFHTYYVGATEVWVSSIKH